MDLVPRQNHIGDGFSQIKLQVADLASRFDDAFVVEEADRQRFQLQRTAHHGRQRFAVDIDRQQPFVDDAAFDQAHLVAFDHLIG